MSIIIIVTVIFENSVTKVVNGNEISGVWCRVCKAIAAFIKTHTHYTPHSWKRDTVYTYVIL